MARKIGEIDFVGILYFPKDDTVAAYRGNLICGPKAGSEPELHDVCIVQIGKASAKKVPWKGILMQKAKGLSARFDADILIADDDTREKLAVQGRATAHALGLPLKHGVNIDRDEELSAEEMRLSSLRFEQPIHSCVQMNHHHRIEVLEKSRGDAEKDHSNLVDSFDEEREKNANQQSATVKRLDSVELRLAEVATAISSTQKYVEEQKSLHPTLAPNKSDQCRTEDFVEKLAGRGIEKWTIACNTMMDEIFSQEKLTMSCPKGGPGSKRPPLEKERFMLLQDVVGGFCKKMNIAAPGVGSFTTAIASRLQTIRKKRSADHAELDLSGSFAG